MNKIFLVSLILLIYIYGCKRGEPDNDIVNPPPGITTLQPIKTIDLSGVIPEPSGITYNSKNNSLWVVSDEKPDFFEIDLNGNLIKKITSDGYDMEGLDLTKNCDTIYVVEESSKLVTTFLTNGTRISSFTVDVATNPSNILEGITIDKSNHLFVLNEKLPRLMIEFAAASEMSRRELTYTTDISDICYDEQLDCFWIVSDESKKIIKISKTGILLTEWQIPFEKGEGITFVQDKMYIVCDSDAKMYIFNKPD